MMIWKFSGIEMAFGTVFGSDWLTASLVSSLLGAEGMEIKSFPGDPVLGSVHILHHAEFERSLL
jgi:hypothetical protein